MFRERTRDIHNKRLCVHLTTDGTALSAGKRENFDMVRGELEQYPHSVAEVVGCSDVMSYDQESVILGFVIGYKWKMGESRLESSFTGTRLYRG